MNIALRRFSYGLAFVVFFMVTPLIVLYASGYRYDSVSGRLHKVGALFIVSVPEKAEIILNDKRTGKMTPALLTAIRPGKNLVSVSREGFQSWQKTLEMKPGETTFIRDVNLFRTQPEVRNLSAGGHSFLPTSDKQWYSYIDVTGHIRLINVATSDVRNGGDALADDLLSWSNDKSLILFKHSDNWFTLNLNSLETKPLAPLITANYHLVQLDPAVAGKYWAIRSRVLYAFTDYNRTQRKMIENVDDYLLTDSRIITVEHTADGTSLRSYALADTTLQWDRLLPTGQNLRLIGSPDNTMLAALGQDATLIISQDDGSEISSIPAAKTAQWLGQKLLIAGDFEIYYFDAKTRKVRLIDRTAERISGIFWHPSGNYLLRIINNRAEAVELDERDRLNVNYLADVNGESWALFNSLGDKLFLLTVDANRQFTVQ